MAGIIPGPDDIIAVLSAPASAGRPPTLSTNGGVISLLSAGKAAGTAPSVNTTAHITRADVKGAT